MGTSMKECSWRIHHKARFLLQGAEPGGRKRVRLLFPLRAERRREDKLLAFQCALATQRLMVAADKLVPPRTQQRASCQAVYQAHARAAKGWLSWTF